MKGHYDFVLLRALKGCQYFPCPFDQRVAFLFGQHLMIKAVHPFSVIPVSLQTKSLRTEHRRCFIAGEFSHHPDERADY